VIPGVCPPGLSGQQGSAARFVLVDGGMMGG